MLTCLTHIFQMYLAASGSSNVNWKVRPFLGHSMAKALFRLTRLLMSFHLEI